MTYNFADDANLLFPSQKLGTNESVMNHELKLLVKCVRSNKLSPNKLYF